MKKLIRTGVLLGLVMLTFTGCNCYNKMKKKVDVVETSSAPSVLFLQGKEVKADITIQFPAKYFNSKAVLRVTPVLVYGGGELAAAPFYVQGDKVWDNFRTISKVSGGTYTHSVSFPYNENMKQSTLELRVDAKCSKGSKKVTTYSPFAVIPVASGVSTVQELADIAGKPAYSADNFQRNTVISQDANIMFQINRSEVRASQLNSEDIKALEDFIVENSGDARKNVSNIYTKAYASPDGPVKLNDQLSQDRARRTETALNQKYAKDKLPVKPQFDVEALGEDWEGFRELVQASDIPDKNLILQVLQMYNDSEKRDAEIKNMSSAFNVLKEKVLPELRRSKLRVDVDIQGKTDAEIKSAVDQNITSLTLEEMLFAANLYNDNATKTKIYKAAIDKYNDYRAWNNYGITLLDEGKVSEASAAFTTAARLNSSSNEVINNLGIAAIANGNYSDAKRYLSSINTEESRYNTGLLNIYEGNYSDAVRNLDGYNLAVAEVLNGNLTRAKQVLAGENSASADYLNAVIAAREGNSSSAISNLRNAISKDASLKETAKKDIEFAKLFGTSEFTSLVR